jgi:superfamily II DNA or RNA helicase
MIDLHTARDLLNFGARIGQGGRAEEQLEGAVAVHNLLATRGVAYLADEVGMGKTYVALGAIALFRHFNPEFRVLIIAPRSNIQSKWMKELRNFVSHNVRFADMRVRALGDRPARPLVSCDNLLDVVREVTIDRDRDFFARLSSFSLPVSGRSAVDPAVALRLRDGIKHYLPWMRDEVFDLRNKQAFKDNFARAICCVLPVFDLVVVDEAHNLKYGFGENVSSRNRVLGLAMGHPKAAADKKLFPGFGPRSRRVLFLSATPVEESYRQLWNQLDVFGLSDAFGDLLRSDIEEEQKKAIAGQFLIRRVTAVRVGKKEYTKNQYRREWRRGGVQVHDQPIQVTDAKQRLVVALVQKKVSELLGNERFNSSFQIGMLASFESFLETTKLKREDTDLANFDDSDQTDNDLEKEGIDVADINRLARSYRQKFGREMPHPKMDALVESLADCWTKGTKTLVFVRRVASVKELKRKLDEKYDEWLIARLIRGLPESMHPRLRQLFETYCSEKLAIDSQRNLLKPTNRDSRDDSDRGGYDTFFAWFFRGEGPRGVVSGANIQQRFIQRGAAYATFFSDNYVADILGCRPGEVEDKLVSAIGVSRDELRKELRRRSALFLSTAKKVPRADRFEAVQAAAIQWLKDIAGPFQHAARIVWHERFEGSGPTRHAANAPPIGHWLELKTFFTELRERSELRDAIWPGEDCPTDMQAFRERELRGQLLATVARLGHGLIDLYVMTMARLDSFELRAQEDSDEDSVDREVGRIFEFLDLLEGQMREPREGRDWGVFEELREIAENYDLILDVNAPDVRHQALAESGRAFGQLLRQQQPIGGMSGQVNQTLVRQFRMPGYPLVLITTDLLQEGEDLHTFCSAVHHYGISWTPSSMEQRIGRIDRVRSQTDRRISALKSHSLEGDDKLQVYFPHLEDTVELLQVQRVLERMNVFLKLMHEGLTTADREQRKINSNQEFARVRRTVQQIEGRLASAFPIRAEHLSGSIKQLAVQPGVSDQIRIRFKNLMMLDLPDLQISWEKQPKDTQLTGTVFLPTRIQPFTLLLESLNACPAIRCISPVGRIDPPNEQGEIVASAARMCAKFGAILTSDAQTYDLTVESEVLFAPTESHDAKRIAILIARVVNQADASEQEYLPNVDEVMDTFREDLHREAIDEH